jgi:hypothetical protein
VDLYDIEKDKWHIQSTSTDEPGYPIYSIGGCAALGGNGSTWEIYMYGSTRQLRYKTDEYASCQDIWVLTIPAFQWFRIRTDHARRALAGHDCHIVGKQLITVAGIEVDETVDPQKTEEQRVCMNSPFRVYDLKKLKVG